MTTYAESLEASRWEANEKHVNETARQMIEHYGWNASLSYAEIKEFLSYIDGRKQKNHGSSAQSVLLPPRTARARAPEGERGRTIRNCRCFPREREIVEHCLYVLQSRGDDRNVTHKEIGQLVWLQGKQNMTVKRILRMLREKRVNEWSCYKRVPGTNQQRDVGYKESWTLFEYWVYYRSQHDGVVGDNFIIDRWLQSRVFQKFN